MKKAIHTVVCDQPECDVWVYSDGMSGLVGNTLQAEAQRERAGWRKEFNLDFCPVHATSRMESVR